MKRFATMLLALALLLTMTLPALAAGEDVFLSNWVLTVDGTAVPSEKYAVDGHNYFKLRDLAMALNGTGSQFSVSYDVPSKAVYLVTGQAYEPEGGELTGGTEDLSSTLTPSNWALYVDGKKAPDVKRYIIGGHNYFQLRDLAPYLNYTVDYTDQGKRMLVYTANSAHRVLNAEEVYARCSPAVFYIEIYDEDGWAFQSGSGFFLTADGVAVTNYHVISGADSAKIMLPDGRTSSVTGVYSWNVDEDWAVLQIEGSGYATLSVGSDTTAVGGAAIYAIGSPEGLQNSISMGIISNANRRMDNMRYLQFDAAISHGSSGGALINKYGEVIGITSATFDYESSQNLNLAVPISYVDYRERGELTDLRTAGNEAESSVYLLENDVTLALGQDYAVLVYSECPAEWSVRYAVENEEIVSCAWSSWDGDFIDLELTALQVGTTTVTVYLLDPDDNVWDTQFLTVTVTPKAEATGGGTLLLDETELTLSLSDQGSFLMLHADVTAPDVDYFAVSYYLDNDSVVKCEWSEWDNHDIDLLLTPLSTGTVTITLVLHEYNNSDRVLDTKTATVTVVPGGEG